MAACGWFPKYWVCRMIYDFSGMLPCIPLACMTCLYHVSNSECKHEVFGADVRISSSGMDGASILDPQWSVNCHWNSFHLVFYHPSDVRQFHHVIVSLWGAGRRTRNLQEAWDWREALVVPGRIDGLKWLSWNIRDACVSFGGMIGKFTDPFSTQSLVERRFQRQLRWLSSDNGRFCAWKPSKGGWDSSANATSWSYCAHDKSNLEDEGEDVEAAISRRPDMSSEAWKTRSIVTQLTLYRHV